MSQISNDVRALFSSAGYVGAIEPNLGLGDRLGTWPPEGTHLNFLTGIQVTPAKFTYRPKESQTNIELPCAEVRIYYQLEEVPPEDSGEWDGKWGGAVATILSDIDHAKLPDNQKTRVRIPIARLKASLKAILGHDPGDGIALLNAIEEVNKRAAVGNLTVNVNVRIKVREVKGMGKLPDKSEQVTEVVSA